MRYLTNVLVACVLTLAALASCTTTTRIRGLPEGGVDSTDPGGPQLADPPACEPSCKGRACGSDGCGGDCGACKAGETCNTNRGTCAATCAPACDGRVCGSDGCGGDCGSCGVGTCRNGECQCTKDADCGAGKLCAQDTSGNHGCASTCNVFEKASCAAGQGCASIAVDGAGRLFASCMPIGTKNEGDPCTDQPNFGGTDCGPGLICAKASASGPPVCSRFCDATHACPKAGQSCVPLADGAGAASPYSVCNPPMGPCQPNPCTEPYKNTCTVVGSTTQCSCNPTYADQGGTCVKICAPSCAGKTCGPDGCGGSCGACAAPAACRPTGQCCAPTCAGKTCGPDGCGGTCGSCAPGAVCNAAGQCNVCAPSCAGRACGPDGCGGSCGFCPAGVCSGAGQCVCSPKCAGKNCGDDGCGGSCGACGGGKTCRAGLCTDPNFCSNAPCYASFAEGGCCASSRFCVKSPAQANTFCRASCGSLGEGCRGDTDCCNPLTCFAGQCQ